MASNRVVLKIEGYLKPKTYIENGKKRAAIEIITNDMAFVLQAIPSAQREERMK